jgi:hypothetical protein
MDKELAQLEEWGVDLINNYEAELQRTDPRSSMHKRIKRFSGELVANPEAYGELLELGRSQGMTGPELVNAIRRIEQGLLDESGKGKAPSRKQMMSDVIHHFYAQRTGGDTLRRLGQADRQAARAALRDEFGRWGNVPENLRSLFRAGHLNNDVLKGIEAEALAEIGVTSPAQLSNPKAHITKGRAVTGDIPGATTAKEAFEGMRSQFEIQGRETQAAIEATQPLMDELDEIAGSKYSPVDMSAQDLEVRRNLLSAKPDQVKAAIKRNFRPFILSRNGALALTPILPGQLKGLATAAQALLDAGSAKAAFEQAQQPMSRREELATALEGTSAVTGLASLTPAAPIAGPVSMGTGLAAAAVRGKLDKKAIEAAKQVKDVERQVFPLQEMINQLPGKALNGLMRLSDMIPAN